MGSAGAPRCEGGRRTQPETSGARETGGRGKSQAEGAKGRSAEPVGFEWGSKLSRDAGGGGRGREISARGHPLRIKTIPMKNPTLTINEANIASYIPNARGSWKYSDTSRGGGDFFPRRDHNFIGRGENLKVFYMLLPPTSIYDFDPHVRSARENPHGKRGDDGLGSSSAARPLAGSPGGSPPGGADAARLLGSPGRRQRGTRSRPR